MDAIIGIFSQFLWPILLGLGALLGAWGYGAKKKRDGRVAERRRAEEARADAKANAEAVREQAAKTPVEQQRKDTSRWER